MILFLVYLTSVMGTAVFLFLTAQVIDAKYNTWQAILLSLLLGLTSILKFRYEWNSIPFTIINAMILLCMLCVLIFAYREKPLRRCAVFGYFAAVWMLSDAVSATLFSLHFGDIGSVFADITPLLIYTTMGAAVFIFIGSISVLVWRMIDVRKFQPFYLLFFILPISQIITVYSFFFSSLTVFWALGVFLGLVADLVLLAYTISQEKKTELEEELRETRHQMELEHFHYREVEQRREELSKIRHDFNNQLASVARLVQSGEEDSAQELIRSLSDEINETVENVYCAIPVVNAILTEKAQVCREASIELDVELDIPDRLTVEPMHLCSIFGNMLDNAIAAVKQVRDDDIPAAIQLSSKVDGDYLFIKTVNPSPEPAKKPLPGRGYGSRILSDLSARYGGNYQGEYRTGTFCAVISLLASDR